MSAVSSTLLHTRYSLIETARVPIAIIGSLVFPSLAFCLFVLPQSVVTQDPVMAVAAVASMVVFAFMSNGLFAFGLDLAEQRSKPWTPYLRTLPGAPLARMAGTMLTTLAMALVAMLPLLVIGTVFTEAQITAGRLTLGIVAVVVTAIPSALIGAVVGIVSSPKAAIAVTQVLMFLLAFAGGLFLPPQLFPQWLDTASMAVPVRQAREIVIAVAVGEQVPWWAVAGIVGWTLVLSGLVAWLHRRDEGRRYA